MSIFFVLRCVSTPLISSDWILTLSFKNKRSNWLDVGANIIQISLKPASFGCFWFRNPAHLFLLGEIGDPKIPRFFFLESFQPPTLPQWTAWPTVPPLPWTSTHDFLAPITRHQNHQRHAISAPSWHGYLEWFKKDNYQKWWFGKGDSFQPILGDPCYVKLILISVLNFTECFLVILSEPAMCRRAMP